MKKLPSYVYLIACAAVLVGACNPLDVNTPRRVDIETPDPDLRPARTLSVMFSIDASVSMQPDGDLLRTVSAAKEALAFLDGRYDLAGLVWFNQSVGIVDLTQNMYNVAKEMDNIIATRQQTRMWDGTYEAVERVVDGPKRDVGGIILVSDGVDETSDTSREDLISYAHKNKVAIYTIGLGNAVDTLSLQTVATATEGLYYHNSGNLDSLRIIFRDIIIDRLRQTP